MLRPKEMVNLLNLLIIERRRYQIALPHRKKKTVSLQYYDDVRVLLLSIMC